MLTWEAVQWEIRGCVTPSDSFVLTSIEQIQECVCMAPGNGLDSFLPFSSFSHPSSLYCLWKFAITFGAKRTFQVRLSSERGMSLPVHGCTMFKMADDFDLCGAFLKHTLSSIDPLPSPPPTILTSWHIALSLVLSAHLTQTRRISSYEVETSG